MSSAYLASAEESLAKTTIASPLSGTISRLDSRVGERVVGTATMALTPDDRDAKGRAFVPNSNDVIAATKLLEPGQSESLRIPANAIRTEGTYEYVCTFPGHWIVMFGELVVTKDVNAYLKANPLNPAKPAAAVTHNH